VELAFEGEQLGGVIIWDIVSILVFVELAFEVQEDLRKRLLAVSFQSLFLWNSPSKSSNWLRESE